MYEKKNGQVLYTCDRCNTPNLLDLCHVRVANILVMDVCDPCARLTTDEIRAKRSPEAIAWYDEVIFNKKPSRMSAQKTVVNAIDIVARIHTLSAEELKEMRAYLTFIQRKPLPKTDEAMRTRLIEAAERWTSVATLFGYHGEPLPTTGE